MFGRKEAESESLVDSSDPTLPSNLFLPSESDRIAQVDDRAKRRLARRHGGNSRELLDEEACPAGDERVEPSPARSDGSPEGGRELDGVQGRFRRREVERERDRVCQTKEGMDGFGEDIAGPAKQKETKCQRRMYVGTTVALKSSSSVHVVADV
jgi:hypothetical protein